MENQEIAETENVETQENQESQESNETREDRRAKHDFLRFKDEAKKLAEENRKLKDQVAEVEKEKLISQNRYKEAYEMEMRKREEAELSLNQTKETFFNGLKYQEIKTQAIKAGIRPEAVDDLSLYDASEVEVETTSHGNANIIGAKEFIEKIKMTRPYLFQDNRPPNVNASIPETTKAKEMKPMDLLKLQRENPVKYKEYVKNKYFN